MVGQPSVRLMAERLRLVRRMAVVRPWVRRMEERLQLVQRLVHRERPERQELPAELRQVRG